MLRVALPDPSSFGHRRWFSRHLAAAALGSALLGSLAPEARAEDKNDKAVLEARQKFLQAISLQTGGNWAAALALLREVAMVKSTPNVLFNIAVCEENIGQLVQALGDYQLAASQTEGGSGDVANAVATRLSTLQERIPKITIKRGANATLAKISVDGVGVGSTMIGVAMAVDPGGHVVEAEARGYKKFEKTFEIAEKEQVTIDVNLVPTKTLEASGAAAPAAADEGEAPSPRTEKHTNLVPYIIGGVGALSLASSGVFFILRQNAISKLDDACGQDRRGCPSSLEGTESSGRTYSYLSLATLLLGVAGVGTAGALLLMGDGSGKGPEAAFTTSAPLADVGASLTGRF